MTNWHTKIMISMLIGISILSGRAATDACGAPAHGSASAPVAAGGNVDSVIAGLPAMLEAWVQAKGLASLSVAVVKDSDIIFSRAFGLADVARGKPATRETMYPVASVTKVFTATMLAQLSERGVVDLDTPVTTYVPEYRIKPEHSGARPASLRLLASHTAGLPKDAPVNFWCNYSYFGWIVTGGKSEVQSFVPTDELLASLGSLELRHEAGIYSHYSNLGMQILGIALERACGKPFTEYIRSEILQPLGMHGSGFMSEETAAERTAVGHASYGPGTPLLPTPAWKPGCAVYSGGLYATADDLARFVSFQIEKASSGKDRILSMDNRRTMRTPNSISKPGRNDSYGLGWALVRIAGYPAIEHNGAITGHTAHASAIPDLGIGVVALANTKHYYWSPGHCKDLAREIHRDLVNALMPPGGGEPFDPGQIDLERYAGTYVLPGGFAGMTIKASDGRLMVSIVEDEEFNEPFIPITAFDFCFEEDPGRTPMLLFDTDDTGKVTRATFLSYTFIRRGE